MNERIRELALEAGASIEENTLAFPVVFGEMEDFIKFAKLIVRECVVQLNIPDVPPPISAGLNLGKEAIKQHFGVE